jgi:hypothetical protein
VHADFPHTAFRLTSPQDPQRPAYRLRLRLEVKLLRESPNLFRCLKAHRQSPLLLPFRSMPEVRGLPSIPFPELPRYYSPLRPPPRPASKILLWATTPHRGRVSHVTQDTFPTCHPHYPGGRKRAPISVSSSSPFGLPRILGGSASTTVLSRPAQGSLSLWPVGLQPAHGGLLSPEVQPEGLPTQLSR